MKRVAVDIGGTFTDCFVCWDDLFFQTKALTNHQNLALGFNEALNEVCSQLNITRRMLLSDVDSVRYATTLGTNALIERSGPKVGLLITHGFESTIPLSRGRGYGEGLPVEEVRDLSSAKRPEPLVPASLIRGIRQRMDYRGKVLVDLSEKQAKHAIRELVDKGVQAIVVTMANAVENPAHELRLQEIFQQEYPPEMLGSIPMILSHQVSGRKGEYVRTSSAIINAYLHSTMYFAMSALEQNLRQNGYTRPMLVVHNSGGMAQLNSTDALQTVHSGPVAGIHAAEELSKQSKTDNIICGDMGGTSFDIGIITEGGEKRYDFNPVVDRWLVTIPMVHLVTLGAGGGSIAKYDRVFNTVKVGPSSAGSDPGPAAYDRGGLHPTVTDADLLLGYLDPKSYANGQIKLNIRRSYQALEDICDELDISEIDAARLIKKLADTSMASGVSRELNSQGYKASDFIFLTYGGNGPLHACGIAEKVGIRRILAPPYSSVFSACGGAGLNQMHIHERNVSFGFFNKSLRSVFSDFDTFNQFASELEAKGRSDLLRQNVDAQAIQHRLELDMRYGSQRMQVSIVAPKNRLSDTQDVIDLIELMNEVFSDRYGATIVSPESGVWVGTIRVVSWVELPALKFEDLTPPENKIATPEPVEYRQCHFADNSGEETGEGIRTPIYDAQALQPGVVINGPAIVNLGTTTYLVESGWRFESAVQGAVWLIKQNQPLEEASNEL